MMRCEVPEPINEREEEELVIKSQVFRVVDEMVEKIVFNNNEDLDEDDTYDDSDDDFTPITSENDSTQYIDPPIIPPQPQFLTDRDAVRALFSYEGEQIGEISRIGEVYCNVCECSEPEVHARIETSNGSVDVMNYSEGPWGRSCVCTSCSMFLERGGRFCVSCGLNENLGRQYGIKFFDTEDSEDICCIHCEDYYPDLYYNQDIHDNADTSNIYQGEYENAELPVNNTEKVKTIKDTLSDMGEMMFDLQDKFTEGEYLKMMNLLQSATNGLNSL